MRLRNGESFTYERKDKESIGEVEVKDEREKMVERV